LVKYTPMIEQYLQIKNNYLDSILFFRLGDFYEMFFEDAETAARELEIVLTARDGGAGKIPMCGIPYHSATNYIARLISRGYKVAICEQVEDPKQAKGIVRREVTQIITPGTVMDEIMLDENNNNYLAAIVEDKRSTGFAYIDISTGEFLVTEVNDKNRKMKIENEFFRINPAECLLDENSRITSLWAENRMMGGQSSLTYIKEISDIEACEKMILHHFNLTTLESLGLKGYTSGLKAIAAILNFLQDTNIECLKNIRSIRTYSIDDYLYLDYTTRRNLELTATIRDGKREGTLLSILDYCRTAMGKRNLKKWVEHPLLELASINRRLDAVEELVNGLELRESLKIALSRVYDLERIAGKISSSIANPRDLIALKKSIEALEDIKTLLQNISSELLQSIANFDALERIYSLIDAAIDEDAPLTIKEGNIIKEGYNKEIDELKKLNRDGSQWLIDFETSEKQRTGIKHLKVGFNKVFGYFIEISRSNLHLVPSNYVRKQTLANTERFICEELKNYEDKILGAKERLHTLEYEEFIRIRQDIGEDIDRIQQTANFIADLDVLYSLAEAAYYNDYNRPKLVEGGILNIKNGRHPVVEKYITGGSFVPNDVKLDHNDHNFAIITGPNMGGKSTFMRQTALLCIMAQMGSFIPADEAQLGVVDKIFTRVGASDDLAAGQSTFMVEMVEMANILNNATRQSLIIMDEIGRGTSTYDGLSLAQAISEYIIDNVGAKSLFATHYHELTELAKKKSGIYNLSVSVKEAGDSVIFLKKVLPGKADRSYGLHVAKLAGIVDQIINRAQEILEELEQEIYKPNTVIYQQPGLFAEENPLKEELLKLDLDNITPRQALDLLYIWKNNVMDD